MQTELQERSDREQDRRVKQGRARMALAIFLAFFGGHFEPDTEAPNGPPLGFQLYWMRAWLRTQMSRALRKLGIPIKSSN